MTIFILILHILGSATLFGIVLISIILVFRQGPLKPEHLHLLGLSKIIGPIAAGVQLLTGLYLYYQNPEEFRHNTLFWVKIALFVVDGLVAVLLVDREVRMLTARGGGPLRGRLPFFILANLVILLTIIAIGVILVENH